MSLLVFRRYELKKKMFSYCLIYIYCLSRNSRNNFVFNHVLFFVIFIQSLLRSMLTLKQELLTPILEFWYFLSRPSFFRSFDSFKYVLYRLLCAFFTLWPFY